MAFSKGAATVGSDGVLVLKAPSQGDTYFITTSSLPELISSISGWDWALMSAGFAQMHGGMLSQWI